MAHLTPRSLNDVRERITVSKVTDGMVGCDVCK